MIHAAIFRTQDPAERATLVISGSPEHIALNVPPGGCWRELPATCASSADLPTLGELAARPASNSPALSSPAPGSPAK